MNNNLSYGQIVRLSYEQTKKTKGFYLFLRDLKTNKEIRHSFSTLEELCKEFYKYVGRNPKYYKNKRIAVLKVDRMPYHDAFEVALIEYYSFSSMKSNFTKKLLPLLKKRTEYLKKLEKTKQDTKDFNKYYSIIENYSKLIRPLEEQFKDKYSRYYYMLLCDELNVRC